MISADVSNSCSFSPGLIPIILIFAFNLKILLDLKLLQMTFLEQKLHLFISLRHLITNFTESSGYKKSSHFIGYRQGLFCPKSSLKNGITEPLELITLPYLTTLNLAFDFPTYYLLR